MAEKFREVEQAFLAALARQDDISALLRDEQELLGLCAGDRAVAMEVRALLRHAHALDEADDTAAEMTAGESAATLKPFLDPAGWHAAAADPIGFTRRSLEDWSSFHPGQRVDGFTLIKECGSGGMGVVYIAEQDQPKRTVAIKLVRRDVATPAMVRRFEREAQLLARLNHPGVAQVYAAGVADVNTSAGAVRVPYIAMELVDGPNLLDYLNDRASDRNLALRLIAQVCDAVQHAHVRGVIHRDLKPSNILVATGAGAEPQVKVVDFGVARQHETEGDDTGKVGTTLFTDHGRLVGTLSYMSPEQVRLGSDVDTRTDVYAIGVILYRLLTGRLPVVVKDCSLPEAARRIVEHEPTLIGAIDRSLKGDVETIASTALQKDPARRYQSPAELARDIQHHLAGEPIEARRDSLLYVLSRRAVRYRAIAITSAILLIVVGVAAAYSRQQQRASALAEKLALASQRSAATARDAAENAAKQLAGELSASRIDQGRLLGAAGDLEGAEKLLWNEYFANPQSRPAYWALRELYAQSGCLQTVAAHHGECWTVSLSADGKQFATGGDEPTVRIWSVPDAKKLADLRTDLPIVYAVSFSHDASRVACGGEGGAEVVSVANGRRLRLGAAGVTARGIDMSATGLAVAVGSEDGFVRLFDPDDGKLLGNVAPVKEGISVRAVRIDPSSTRLAAAYADGSVRLWNIALARGSAVITPGPEIAGRPGTTGYGVDFSPDGELLASGSSDRTMTLWSTADGHAVTTIGTNNGSARAVAFSPDGKTLAIPGFWRTKVFNLGGEVLPTRAAWGNGGSHCAAYTPDGKLLVATGPNGTCRVWDLAADPTTVMTSTVSPVREIAIRTVGDECVMASVQNDGEIRVRVRNNSAGAWRETLRCNAGGRGQTLVLTGDARQMIVGRVDGHLIVLDVSDGRMIQDVAAHKDAVNVVRLTPDGARLISGSSDNSIKIWNRAGDSWKLETAMQCDGNVISAAVQPGGHLLATTARPSCVQFWELPSGRPMGKMEMVGVPWRLAFSPDGKRLAAGFWDRSVRVWELLPQRSHAAAAQEARLVSMLSGHSQLVLNEAFDASGELLASVSNDGSLRIWDLAGAEDEVVGGGLDRRRCLITLDAGAGDSLAVAFVPGNGGGGMSAAVGYYDGSVRAWDLEYFDRHVRGQVDYQSGLRRSGTTAPSTP